MRALTAIGLLALGVASSRPGDNSPVAPADTSYTITSAYAKIHATFPFARIAAPEVAHGVVLRKDIVYASPGGRALHLDLLRPLGSARCPAVLLIHGGGWRSGDRSMSLPMAIRLASHGYVAATAEYRLSPEALYPAAVHDLKAAVRWLRAQGNRYHIDTSKIAVLGCSAGGQLAALLGTTNGDPRFEGDEGSPEYSSAVQAVVDIDGILDFTDPAESGKDTIPGKPSAGASWFGATFREKPELWIEASPLAHVSGRTAPMAFINSAVPRFHAGRDSLIARLDKLGISSEVHTLAGTPHTFWLFHPWFEPTCNLTKSFLDTVFHQQMQKEKGKRQKGER